MAENIRVTVMWSPTPREVREWQVELPAGATVGEAVAASGMQPTNAITADMFGVWGRRADSQQTLRDQDRVEIYRALVVDPKVARRERFKRQGARATGLFAGRRPGSKAGY